VWPGRRLPGVVHRCRGRPNRRGRLAGLVEGGHGGQPGVARGQGGAEGGISVRGLPAGRRASTMRRYRGPRSRGTTPLREPEGDGDGVRQGRRLRYRARGPPHRRQRTRSPIGLSPPPRAGQDVLASREGRPRAVHRRPARGRRSATGAKVRPGTTYLAEMDQAPGANRCCSASESLGPGLFSAPSAPWSIAPTPCHRWPRRSAPREGEADVAGDQFLVDGMAQSVDAPPLLLRVGQGDPGRPARRWTVLECRGDLARARGP